MEPEADGLQQRLRNQRVHLSGKGSAASAGRGNLDVSHQEQISDAVGVTDSVTYKLTHTISYEGPPLSPPAQEVVARLIKSLQEYEATQGEEGEGTPSRLAWEAAEEARELLTEVEEPPTEVIDLLEALKASVEKVREQSRSEGQSSA